MFRSNPPLAFLSFFLLTPRLSIYFRQIIVSLSCLFVLVLFSLHELLLLIRGTHVGTGVLLSTLEHSSPMATTLKTISDFPPELTLAPFGVVGP